MVHIACNYILVVWNRRLFPKKSNMYISTPLGSLMWWGPQFAYYGAKAECGAKAGCENISQVWIVWSTQPAGLGFASSNLGFLRPSLNLYFAWHLNDHSQAGISRNFGFVMTFAGLIGVPAGSYISQTIRRTIPNADPIVSGVTLLFSVPGETDAASSDTTKLNMFLTSPSAVRWIPGSSTQR